MSDKRKNIIKAIADAIDIPASAYEKAEARYKDLGEWFGRDESNCADFDPHIYPQGSFRLGTVVRSDEYDLDFGCRLRQGVSKSTHSQKELKDMVGADMEAYRVARGIQSSLEAKHRCWRLQYADELSFHMDGVPSIPEEEPQRLLLKEAMIKAGSVDTLAEDVAKLAGAITDDRLPNFEKVDSNWRISNSEGYALWFETQMLRGFDGHEKRAFMEAKASQVDRLPGKSGRTVLQRCVQVLKRHRDIMFEDNEDSKPISIIITTLAAMAYQGERDVASALETILSTMGNLVSPSKPRVPNPVNPAEDFADRWYDPASSELKLEENFNLWLQAAQRDFAIIGESSDMELITEQAREKFGSVIDPEKLKESLGLGAVTEPKRIHIKSSPAKPWCRIL